MENTQLAVSVPQTVVRDIVQAEIVRQLGANGTELIHRIVDQALSEECKCDSHRYGGGRVSKITCEINKEINTSARAAVKEWVLKEQPNIAKAVEVALKKNGARQFADSIVKAMVAEASWGISISVAVKAAK